MMFRVDGWLALALAAAPLTASASPPSMANERDRYIAATVMDEPTWKPVQPGVQIRIDELQLNAKVDSAGRYRVRVPPETYRVRAQRLGCHVEQRTVRIYERCAGVETLNFYMRPAAIELHADSIRPE